MKTAMQEVLNLVEQMFNNADALKLELPASLLNDVINIITQEGMPKEKEQIENAHANNRCLQNKTMECTIEAYKNAEKYYKETYNK